MFRRDDRFTLLLIGLLATAAMGAVTVDRKPLLLERKTFDPGHPPAEMPSLKPDEAAVTESRFDCEAAASYQVTARRKNGGRCSTTLKIQSVAVTLKLRIVIWLPKGDDPRLSSHEDGHRQITERVYREAEAAARALAGPVDGKNFTGEAATCPAAEKQATQGTLDEICREYLRRIAKRAARINDIYDDITAHGTRKEPAVDEAIRQAFARDQKQAEKTGH